MHFINLSWPESHTKFSFSNALFGNDSPSKKECRDLICYPYPKSMAVIPYQERLSAMEFVVREAMKFMDEDFSPLHHIHAHIFENVMIIDSFTGSSLMIMIPREVCLGDISEQALRRLGINAAQFQ